MANYITKVFHVVYIIVLIAKMEHEIFSSCSSYACLDGKGTFAHFLQHTNEIAGWFDEYAATLCNIIASIVPVSWHCKYVFFFLCLGLSVMLGMETCASYVLIKGLWQHFCPHMGLFEQGLHCTVTCGSNFVQ